MSDKSKETMERLRDIVAKLPGQEQRLLCAFGDGLAAAGESGSPKKRSEVQYENAG